MYLEVICDGPHVVLLYLPLSSLKFIVDLELSNAEAAQMKTRNAWHQV